jgi:hypothetical protein
MADEVGIKYLYPPNYNPLSVDGKDNGNRRYVLLLTSISDGTGEDLAIKVRRTDLLTTNGNVPSQLVVEKLDFEVTGMTVYLEFNGNTDEKIAILNANTNSYDYTSFGGMTINDTNDDDDPEWGNILLTTSGETSGDTYNITLTVRAKD